jgi:hypothetical protein
MQCGESQLMLWRNTLPPSSGSDSQTKKLHEAGSRQNTDQMVGRLPRQNTSACCLLYAGFLLHSFFDPEIKALCSIQIQISFYS